MKAQSLLVLKDFEQILIKIAWKQMPDLGTKGAILLAIRDFAKRLGIQLTKRWALKLIPIISALIGGAFNAVYANDVGRAAYMCYRRRFILQNKLSEDATDLVIKTTSSPECT